MDNIEQVENLKPKVNPTAEAKRFISIDVLRGFAIFGILFMNIQNLSMISAAYLNPTAYGDFTGINKLVWIFTHIFTDLKFITIFSILFGAGIVLITGKLEAKGLKSAGLHYRRTFWLIIIGLMHAYLLWYGDILVIYGLCAIVVFLFRKISPWKLLIIGLFIIAIPSVFYFLAGSSMPHWPAEAIQDIGGSWKPGIEQVAKEVSAYQGSWLSQMAHRVPTSIFIQTFFFFIFQAWRVAGSMLIGMAIYKMGILTAERSKRFYITSMILGFGIGFPIVIFGIFRNFAENWTLEYSMFFGAQYNYWGSLFIAFGYICTIMLIYQKFSNNKFIRIYAGIGRTALSNYLIQTIICTTLFYGHGFGLFGQVERYQQFLIIIGVWTIQLLLTPIWLHFFRFGLFEWLWRSLTYIKLQPFRNK